MNHLDEGTLQAFLDDELAPRERAEAAEHLMGCGTCRAAHDELRSANALFSEAMAELDTAPLAGAAPGVRRGRRVARLGTGTFVKAAGLTLFVAAAASAAVPGSPVRAWIESVVVSTPEPAPPPAAAPVAESPAAPAGALPAGLSVMPRAGRVDVEVTGLENTTIRLQEGVGESVTVSSRGAQRDPSFRSASGRIGVRGGVGGELLVELPPSLPGGRLVVDGRVYAEVVSGELLVRVPGETVDGAVVWR